MLTIVQPVQIVPYTLSHSVDQMSHSQTAPGDWRCSSHSNGDVRQASITGALAVGHRQKEPRRVSSEFILGAVGQQHGLVLTAGAGLPRLLEMKNKMLNLAHLRPTVSDKITYWMQ